jgi:uncharacterized protein (UPF0335 family)
MGVVPIRAGGPAVAADQLRLFIERAERLHEEVKGANEDLADVFKEAKANGYDTKAMKRCMALRRSSRRSGKRTTRSLKPIARRSACLTAAASGL